MEEIDNLINKIRTQTNSFNPNDYSSSSSMPLNNIANISDVEKPRFSEITPYSENTIYKTLSSGEKISMFENFIPGTDNMERLAQNQTTGEKWSNGALKALSKTGNAVLGGTVGLVYGVGSALKEGSFSALYDNDFSNKMNDLDTKLNYQLANYYTKQEQEAGVFGQMKYANFWADKFLGGLSFTAGAIISEGIWAWATGGTSLATIGARRAGRWGVEAIGEANVLKGMANMKSQLSSLSGQTLQAGAKSKTLANLAGDVGKLTSTAGFMARSAGYEASVEALQYKKEAEENFYNNFAKLNGREPNAEDIAKFEKDNESAANSVFGANMAILGVSNLAMFGHVLDIKNPIKTGFSSFVDKKAFGYGLDKATGKVLERTTRQKITKNLFDYAVKPSLTEGLFEEGLQGVTQKYNNKWIEHSYNPKYTSETFNTMDAMYDSLAEQYGSTEGWKENVLGMLIGIVGGSVNVRSEQKAKEAELKMQEAVGQQFNAPTMQMLLLPNRIQTANRVAGFSEQAKEHEQKGDIALSTLAKQNALQAVISAKLTLGESVSDITKFAEDSLNSLTPDQWKEVGVEADQIGQEKTERISEFKNLAQQWKTNKKYVQYIIGDRLVGEQNLPKSNLENIYGEFSKNAQIVEALTWQITTGENANKLMKDTHQALSDEIGSEVARVLDLKTKLSAQNNNRKSQIAKNQNKYNKLLAKREELTQKIAELNDEPSLKGDKEGLSPRVGMSADLLKIEQQISKIQEESTKIADELNSNTNYEKGVNELDLTANLSGTTISSDDLLNLNKNIKKFKGVLESYETANPQKAKYLNDLLDEYSQAENVFLDAQLTHRIIASPNFKMENIGGWLSGKLKGKKAMAENTQEWLVDAITTYAKSKSDTMEYFKQEQEIKAQKELEKEKKDLLEELKTTEDQTRLKETDIRLSEIEAQLPQEKDETASQPKEEEEIPQKEIKTEIEQYKDRIERVLKNYDMLYIGDNYDGVANQEPTQAEIEEYKRLRESLKDTTLQDNADKFSPRQRIENLIGDRVEQKRFKQLEAKLKNWKLLDSAVDSDNTSIVEIIKLIQSLEAEIDQNETKDEVTQDDVFKSMTGSDLQTSGSAVRYDLGVNVKANATVKALSDEIHYELTHIKAKYIVEQIGGEYTIQGKGKDIDSLQPDDIITIDGMNFKYTVGGRLRIKKEDLQARAQQLNLYVVDTKAVNWSFPDIYTIINNEWVKMPSQFEEANLEPEASYNSVVGDTLSLVIDDVDGWNKTKIGGTKENLKIFMKDKNGKLIQTLKGGRETQIDQNFENLRQTAFDTWERAGKPSKSDLGISVEVSNVFLGSPEYNFQDGVALEQEITKEAVDKVVIAKGYILDGEITLDTEIENIDKTYVGQISKNNAGLKQPIVVFRRGAYNVAFPISMIKKPSPVNFDALLVGTTQEMVLAVNDATIKNGIKTEKLTYKDIQIVDGQIELSDRAQVVKQAFAENTTFTSADQIADKKYKKENLVDDATIKIDLNNVDKAINSPKVRINLENVKYKTTQDVKYDNQIEIENRLSELAIELSKDYAQNASTKYVDSKGNIIEDTAYTNILDDNEIVKTNNQIQKVGNLNILRQAFSEKLTPTLKKAIGEEKIKEVQDLFKQYDFIKSQIIVKENDGNKNICK